MSNMLSTIAPKSNQLNADDLIGGVSKIIKITAVKVGSGDQPVSLSYEGDDGKPFLPCKSMRRVLVHVWGKDGNAYVGRSMTLYRDDAVKFGGVEVGGIRISHMSDIKESVTMALTASRAQRKSYTVQPLPIERSKDIDPSAFTAAIEKVQRAITEAELDAAIEESRKLKGWPKATGQQMKLAIDAQREAIKKQSEERQPGE